MKWSSGCLQLCFAAMWSMVPLMACIVPKSFGLWNIEARVARHIFCSCRDGSKGTDLRTWNTDLKVASCCMTHERSVLHKLRRRKGLQVFHGKVHYTELNSGEMPFATRCEVPWLAWESEQLLGSCDLDWSTWPARSEDTNHRKRTRMYHDISVGYRCIFKHHSSA